MKEFLIFMAGFVGGATAVICVVFSFSLPRCDRRQTPDPPPTAAPAARPNQSETARPRVFELGEDDLGLKSFRKLRCHVGDVVAIRLRYRPGHYGGWKPKDHYPNYAMTFVGAVEDRPADWLEGDASYTTLLYRASRVCRPEIAYSVVLINKAGVEERQLIWNVTAAPAGEKE